MSIIQKSIGKLLSDVVKANSDRDALVHTEIGNRYSYVSLSQELDRAARGFLKCLGLFPLKNVLRFTAHHPC
jgi:non-ribosomal peptide synthetase component E (peptide arylation enzyme)